MNYTIRKTCIFCKNVLHNLYFKNDLECSVAHYAIDIHENNFQKIPFNIFTCNVCSTVQNKYLGNLDEIYKSNHADSTGKIMIGLHNTVANLIIKNRDSISNIIEIGSAIGELSELILKKLDIQYNIIEPCFIGNQLHKIIINDFYENVDDTKINANTMIISHVFEHFYEPLDILEKIVNNKNIENFFLIFPDLEYYINNEVLHVLNTEHTYYIDNKFLIKLLYLYNFSLVEKIYYENHSVIMYFKRNNNTKLLNYEKKIIHFKNENYSLDTYYNSIFNKINYYNSIIDNNSDKKIFIWPASIHTLYLLDLGLNTNFLGFLDNSKNKIGKKVYGTNKQIYSYKSIIDENNKNVIIIVNGGVFNKELKDDIDKANNILFINYK